MRPLSRRRRADVMTLLAVALVVPLLLLCVVALPSMLGLWQTTGQPALVERLMRVEAGWDPETGAHAGWPGTRVAGFSSIGWPDAHGLCRRLRENLAQARRGIDATMPGYQVAEAQCGASRPRVVASGGAWSVRERF